jgi:DNA-binding beta-propeller fold protein YncE
MDLATDAILWRRSFGAYADSLAVTPDGKTLYLPCRHAGEWWVIDAEYGDVLAKVETGRGGPYAENAIKDFGPHNTVCNESGTRMYLAAMTIPYVFVADTRTHSIARKIGPFSRGVRPFAVSPDEAYVFANVDGLLGFEVADARTGRVLRRVEARVPPERIPHVKVFEPHHHTPSHGINLRPGTSELWVSDDVHGYLYVYDVSKMPPRHVADVPLFAKPWSQPKPAWVSFSLDGRYAYASCNVVIDAETRKIAARMDTSERLLEIQFRGGRAVRAGRR